MPLSKRKKRSFLIAWLVIFFYFMYVGYALSGLFLVKGLTVDTIGNGAIYLLTHPSLAYWNEKTKWFLSGFFLLWFFLVIYSYTSQHELRTGEEFGTSKWGEVKDVTKRLASLMTCYFLCFQYKKPDNKNKIISENIRLSYDGDATLLNNNILVIGGSGAGKTAFFITPNTLQNFGSNIHTDPKGSLVKEVGNYLESLGRRVLSLNLCDMHESCRYNPFKYIRKTSDVNKLITNLISNTTPGNAHSGDPFWEKSEKMYLTAIFNYVWLECPRKETIKHENDVTEEITLDSNFRTVLHLLDEAAVDEDGNESALDERMNKLAMEKGEKHPAVRSYRRCVRGAGDTVRSIIISANARFDPFDDEDLLRILDGDDIDLPTLGVGVNGDMETLTSLFCCIPDDDDTYNFVPGMLYTQLFQELYRQARFYKGKLPIPVGFWFDEFANIKMPNYFEKILATCRSRDIYCAIVLQSLAQLKSAYKDGQWEGILGNCDTILYLGGNEPSSHEYISKQLSKETIEKRSHGESTGGQGSSSQNYDVLGRELMTTDEVARLKNQCICLIRGEYPLLDQKWNYFKKHKKIRKEVLACGVFEQNIHIRKEGTRFITEEVQEDVTFLKPKSIAYYEQCKAQGENITIYKLDMETFLTHDFSNQKAGDVPTEIEIMKLLEIESQEKLKEETREVEKETTELSEKEEQKAFEKPYKNAKEQLIGILSTEDFNEGQIRAIKTAILNKITYEKIVSFAKVSVSAEKMELMTALMMEE